MAISFLVDNVLFVDHHCQQTMETMGISLSLITLESCDGPPLMYCDAFFILLALFIDVLSLTHLTMFSLVNFSHHLAIK
jgi:hypothetical protein